jgi:predicted RNase H-like HicB family nuclease
MHEAMEMHLRGMEDDGLPIPEPTATATATYVSIAV